MEQTPTHHETANLCDKCANDFVTSEEGHTVSRRHDPDDRAVLCTVCRRPGHVWTVETDG